jgi:DNA-directed RNA polymerase subunit M/transcription elongation factor TFIIS
MGIAGPACPICKKAGGLVEAATTTVAIFRCEGCEHRWAVDVPGRSWMARGTDGQGESPMGQARRDVFFFDRYDVYHGGMVTQARPGTVEAIRRAGGTPILDSAFAVEVTDLDEEGFVRQATRACEACGRVLEYFALSYEHSTRSGPRWDQSFVCRDCHQVWTLEASTGVWRRHGPPKG